MKMKKICVITLFLIASIKLLAVDVTVIDATILKFDSRESKNRLKFVRQFIVPIEEKTTNQTISKKDTIPNKDIKTIISYNNDIVRKEDSVVRKNNEFKELRDSTIPYMELKDLHGEIPEGQPITTSLPPIFTELFNDVKWELVINNEGLNRYYRTTNLDKYYSYDLINEFINLKYKVGEIKDKQIIDLFIFWFFHPYDTNMILISTKYYENKIKKYYNYESLIIFNGEEIQFYSIVKENKFIAYKSFKNGNSYKSGIISY
jgi:hypothetical protein